MTIGTLQVFVVLVFQMSVVDVTVMLGNFEHISQYDDKRGIDSNCLTRRVVTLCGCGVLCGLEIDSCKSFFYQKGEGLCSLYTDDLFGLKLVNASGSKGYSLKRHTEEEETTAGSSTETLTSTSQTTSTSPTTTTAQETLTSTSPATTAQETTTSTLPATTEAPTTLVPTTAAPQPGCHGDDDDGDEDDDECDGD